MGHSHGPGGHHHDAEELFEKPSDLNLWQSMVQQFGRDGALVGVAALGAGANSKLLKDMPPAVRSIASLLEMAPMYKEILIPDLIEVVKEKEIPDAAMISINMILGALGVIAPLTDKLSDDFGIEAQLSSALLTGTFSFAGGVEDNVTERLEAAIKAILEEVPEEVTRVTTDADGHTHEETISMLEIQKGDVIRLNKGQRLPADARIMTINGTAEGEAIFDTALHNGKKEAVLRAGESVFGGAIIADSNATFEVLEAPEDSAIARFFERLQHADEASRETSVKDEIKNYINFFYLPGLVALLGATTARSAWDGENQRFDFSKVDWGRVVETEAKGAIAGAPCPWDASRSIYNIVQMGLGGMFGVTVNNKGAFEQLEHVDVVLTDMNGTITNGNHTVEDFQFSSQTVDADKAMRLLHALESHTTQTHAQAFVKHAASKGLVGESEWVTEEDTSLGKGIRGTVDGHKVIVGSLSQMQALDGVEVPEDVLWDYKEYSQQGKTVSLFAIDGEWGIVTFEDQLRPEIPAALKKLQDKGVEIYLVTGNENRERVLQIAQEAGIDITTKNQDGSLKYIKDNMRSEEKEAFAAEIMGQGHVVAAIGDDNNDALFVNRVMAPQAGEKMGVGIAIKDTMKDATSAKAGMIINSIGELPDHMSLAGKVNKVASICSNIAKAWIGALVSVFSWTNVIKPAEEGENRVWDTAAWAGAHEFPTVAMIVAQGLLADRYLKEYGASQGIEVEEDTRSFMQRVRDAVQEVRGQQTEATNKPLRDHVHVEAHAHEHAAPAH